MRRGVARQSSLHKQASVLLAALKHAECSCCNDSISACNLARFLSPVETHQHVCAFQIEAVAALRHPNIIRLLGYCLDFDAGDERHEQVLIYELAPNGDLETLMDKRGTWVGAWMGVWGFRVSGCRVPVFYLH